MVMVMEKGEVCWGGILKIGNCRCFRQRSHNQQSYVKTETAAGFSTLNRPREHVSRLFSDCSGDVSRGGEV